MSRNGSGIYSLPAGNPVTTGTTITSTWANNTLNDLASAMTQSVAKDGQTVMTANLNMGGFRLTNNANGVASTDLATIGQLALKLDATGGTASIASLTLSSGTANGVLYLNGSKLASSGSALTFDGTNLGIGTSSPGSKLDVATTDATAWAANTNAPIANLYNASATANSAALFQASITNSDSTLGGVKFGAIASGAYSADFVIANRNVGVFQENFRVTSTGNLGLGVVPSGWRSNTPAFQLGSSGVSLYADSGVSSGLGNNFYLNVSSQYIYQRSDLASRFEQYQGQFKFFTAPSGTAGAAITWTQAMTLDASGNKYGPAGSTSMANGFFYIPSAAGVPTGVPTAVSGNVPMYYDSTNNKFYIYNGAWKSVTLA